MLLHSPDASSDARWPWILVLVTEPSAPEPDPAEQAPQHQPADPARRPVEPRIGDADRDQAVNFLQEHMAQGRIDASEFDDRMSRALKAKTASELATLFDDLPEPRPPAVQNALVVPGATMAASGATDIRNPALAAYAGSQPGVHTVRLAIPERSKADTVLAVVAAASWPAVILFCFATSWSYWWLVFIPIFISTIAGNLRQQRRGRR